MQKGNNSQITAKATMGRMGTITGRKRTKATTYNSKQIRREQGKAQSARRVSTRQLLRGLMIDKHGLFSDSSMFAAAVLFSVLASETDISAWGCILFFLKG